MMKMRSANAWRRCDSLLFESYGGLETALLTLSISVYQRITHPLPARQAAHHPTGSRGSLPSIRHLPAPQAAPRPHHPSAIYQLHSQLTDLDRP